MKEGMERLVYVKNSSLPRLAVHFLHVIVYSDFMAFGVDSDGSV
jgi:hypothetical protein